MIKWDSEEPTIVVVSLIALVIFVVTVVTGIIIGPFVKGQEMKFEAQKIQEVENVSD